MSELIEHLKRFNRKERYWVVQNALGSDTAQTLGVDFLIHLSVALGEPVPANAWWAMDYHFDWLAGALAMRWPGACKGALNEHQARANGELDAPGRLITGTQEDIDLIVAYGDTVVLIEAKADTAWGTDQLHSKIKRLAALNDGFSEEVMQRLRFVLMSPARPKFLKPPAELGGWPSVMRKRDDSEGLMWMELTMGTTGRKEFSYVTRCTEQGVSDSKGTFWRVVHRSDAVLPEPPPGAA